MSIKNLKPSATSRYHQGYYNIKNISKYRGDASSIICRSSYETKFCFYCDNNDSIVEWNSESVSIRYTSLADNRQHTYYLDFWIRLADGREFIVEVKPDGKLKKPKQPSKKATAKQINSYNIRLKEYLVNFSKFRAAKIYANQIGMDFILVTESFLFNIK